MVMLGIKLTGMKSLTSFCNFFDNFLTTFERLFSQVLATFLSSVFIAQNYSLGPKTLCKHIFDMCELFAHSEIDS